MCACVQDGELYVCTCARWRVVCVCERKRERSEANKSITLASKQVNHLIVINTGAMQYVFTWPSNGRVAINKFDFKQYTSISTLLKDSIAHHWSTSMFFTAAI